MPALSASERAVTTGSAPVPMRRLWIGVVAAPTAWLLAELIGYYFSSRNCEPFHGGIPLAGLGAATPTHLIVTLALALVGVWGLYVALANWRALRGDHSPGDLPAWGRARFMSFGGVLVSALFVLGMVMFALPGVVVDACSQLRGF